jgi:hypothetical protein
MSDPPGNFVVNMLGGRSGPLGRLYTPTIAEQVEERTTHLRREIVRAELDEQDRLSAIRKTERHVKRCYERDRKPELRRAVRVLRREQLAYAQAGRRVDNLVAVTSTIESLRSCGTIESAIEFYAQAMTQRMSSAHPERFQRILERCSRVKSLQDMTTEMLEEFFVDEEDAERARTDDDRDEDTIVNEVLVELHIIKGIESAPALRVVDALPTSRDNRGNGNDNAGAPLLRSDETTVAERVAQELARADKDPPGAL